MAIWDTGATNSVITKNVVATCGLRPTGIASVHHAAGTSQVETYAVNIFLPNGVQFPFVQVTLGDLPSGTDALIGMDIIGAGDFVVTSVGGKMMFSYRYPSIGVPDFADEIRIENERLQIRNFKQEKKSRQSRNGPVHQKLPPRGQRKRR